MLEQQSVQSLARRVCKVPNLGPILRHVWLFKDIPRGIFNDSKYWPEYMNTNVSTLSNPC